GAHCGTITGASAQRYKLGAIDAGSTIRVLETARAGGLSSVAASSAPTALIKSALGPHPDAARQRGWRSCLAKVTAGAKHARAVRARCVKIWGRTPGRVTGLRAITRGKSKIELDFYAPGTNAKHPPPASGYLVKQSLRPITSQHDFTAAPALCKRACRFHVTQIGTRIKLLVTALHPRTTYYYAIAALDNVTARPGPRTTTVKTKTA
ncbi:MAG: hypothetical protein M3Z06_12835, partial [Actinomycetota bacterium]|nr:hypothetical protein [Actinomycetota bacterium]